MHPDLDKTLTNLQEELKDAYWSFKSPVDHFTIAFSPNK